MGDVNESNVFVSVETGEVRLIDCDSFQIQGPNGRIYPCSVFTADWAPPELIESPSLIARRTVQHDLFGLAVLIFHLLFMGKHPYAGVPPDHLLENSPSLEELIKQSIFPYSQNRRGSFKPPPNFLTLAALPESIAGLFERAFLTRNRPAADEWCRELDRIELRKCQWGHVFYRQLKECPWCAIWNRGGGNFFVVVAASDGSSSSLAEIDMLLSAAETTAFVNFNPVWTSLERSEAVTFTVPVFASLNIQPLPPTPFPKIRKERLEVLWGVLLFIAGLLTIFFIPAAFVLWLGAIALGVWLIAPGAANQAYNREIESRKKAPEQTRAVLDAHLQSMQRFANSSLMEFKDERRKAGQKVAALFEHEKRNFEAHRDLVRQDLKILYAEAKELPKLLDSLRRQSAEKAQLEAYLRGIRVPKNGIRQIGEARYNTLVTHGIFTAWDVRRMGGVPGLGPGAIELRAWLRTKEDRFQFNPAAPLPSAAEQEVRKAVQAREQEILKKFQKLRARWFAAQQMADPSLIQTLVGEAVTKETRRLDELNLQIKFTIEEMRKTCDDMVRQHSQALADAKSCPRPAAKWG